MPTLAAGDSDSFTLDAFGHITVTSVGAATLTGVSQAPSLKSNIYVSKVVRTNYGPYGVPMLFTIASTDGSLTYSTTAGYSGSAGYLGIVADEDAMLALDLASPGDEVYRTDTGTFWKLRVAGSNNVSNWTDTGVEVAPGVYRGIVANEAAMLAIDDAVAGDYVKRTDTDTNWQIDSDADPEDTSGERLARWRDLGAVITPPIAATDVTIADAAGHYTGADAETVLDEVGDRLAVLEDPPVADLWNYLLGLNDSTTVSPFGVALGQFGTTTLGSAGMAMVSIAGTAAAATFADTNVATRNPHLLHDSSASADSIAGYRSPPVGVISTTAGRGGCYTRFMVGAGDGAAVADAGCFYGVRITASNWTAATDFTSMVSCVGFGVDSAGGTELTLIHNDASGNINKIALSGSWPANDTAEAYDCTLDNPPGTRDWNWSITKKSDGTTLSGTLDAATYELPATDTVPHVHLMRRNGATALAVTLRFYFCARGRIDLPALAESISGGGGGGGGIDLANPDPFTLTQGVTAVNLGNISGNVTLTPRTQSNTMYAVLTGNVTFLVPTGGRSGDKLTLYLKQDGTGSRTITMNASIKPLVGGATLLASTLAATVDVLLLEYVDHDSGWRYSFINGTV